eukprot:scaffold68543_cov55-Phaeocystis_antarctica.AAC.3
MRLTRPTRRRRAIKTSTRASAGDRHFCKASGMPIFPLWWQRLRSGAPVPVAPTKDLLARWQPRWQTTRVSHGRVPCSAARGRKNRLRNRPFYYFTPESPLLTWKAEPASESVPPP